MSCGQAEHCGRHGLGFGHAGYDEWIQGLLWQQAHDVLHELHDVLLHDLHDVLLHDVLHDVLHGVHGVHQDHLAWLSLRPPRPSLLLDRSLSCLLVPTWFLTVRAGATLTLYTRARE